MGKLRKAKTVVDENFAILGEYPGKVGSVTKTDRSRLLDLRGELPELPEEYTKNKEWLRRVDDKHDEFKVEAKETGKAVPGIVADELIGEIESTGYNKGFLHDWTPLGRGQDINTANAWRGIRKNMAPLDFVRGATEAIDARQGERKSEDLSKDARRIYDQLGNADVGELRKLEDTAWQDIDILNNKEYTDVIGKQTDIGNTRISPQTLAGQLQNDLSGPLRTETMGARDAESEHAEASSTHSTAMDRHTKALDNNTKELQRPKKTSSWLHDYTPMGFVKDKISLHGTNSHKGNN